MKRMVKIPSGTWLDIDLISTIEEDSFGKGTNIHMQSGRVVFVAGLEPDLVLHDIQTVWGERESSL